MDHLLCVYSLTYSCSITIATNMKLNQGNLLKKFNQFKSSSVLKLLHRLVKNYWALCTVNNTHFGLFLHIQKKWVERICSSPEPHIILCLTMILLIILWYYLLIVHFITHFKSNESSENESGNSFKHPLRYFYVLSQAITISTYLSLIWRPHTAEFARAQWRSSIQV